MVRVTRRKLIEVLGLAGPSLVAAKMCDRPLRASDTLRDSLLKNNEARQQNPYSLLAIAPQLSSFEFNVIALDKTGKKINQERRQTQLFREELGKGISLEMVSIPGGKFLMGSPANKPERDDSETPQHWREIAPFFIGKFTITQAQWREIAALPKIALDLDPNPAHYSTDNRPVEQISWYDAIEFCARLSQKTGRNYRLPSEAEWEYACRAETTTPFHFGETINPELANYNGDYTFRKGPKGSDRGMTMPVGSFGVANNFGLYDMHGNIWEWCADPWHENYQNAPRDGRIWETRGDRIAAGQHHLTRRILRGGSWNYWPRYCQSAVRFRSAPSIRYLSLGFRVALTLE